jgi:hypothetical protein
MESICKKIIKIFRLEIVNKNQITDLNRYALIGYLAKKGIFLLTRR